MTQRSSSISRLFALILAWLPFTACSAPLVGNGKIEVERREVPSFKSVAFSGSGSLRIRRGPQSLSVSVDSNLLPYIETRVAGDKLLVGIKPGVVLLNTNNLVVDVAMPDLEGIDLSGSGKAKVERFSGERLSIGVSGSGKLEADIDYRELGLSLSGSGSCGLTGRADRAKYVASGSGKVDAKVDYRELDLRSSGSGSFSLSGKAERASFSISGSCGIDAGDLALERAVLDIGGSGDATVRASKSLDLSISGSGKVGYYGRPALSQRVSGSGKVVSLGN